MDKNSHKKFCLCYSLKFSNSSIKVLGQFMNALAILTWRSSQSSKIPKINTKKGKFVSQMAINLFNPFFFQIGLDLH